ncbi:hypothetical protein P7K49_019041 [Saguinus oedipus]|uniref:WASH1 WAHD domain-containing protein n=1 Tax=Saguinus oedipus TaxID=9490 RepID=A0ABQ9UWE6_SAGOE|nr:hypothetical protein P7K49_019041 [Saguinus oedipus]
MTPVKTQHSLAGQTYAVPLIQPDLRREEAVQQMADALQYLQKVSGDIFSRPGAPDPSLCSLLFCHQLEAYLFLNDLTPLAHQLAPSLSRMSL